MDIIIDRKKKRFKYGMDLNWDDPLFIESAKCQKAITIDIPNDSRNPIHNYMRRWGHKALLGKRAFALKDTGEILSGFIVDIIPPYYISLKDKGVVKIDDVISIGE